MSGVAHQRLCQVEYFLSEFIHHVHLLRMALTRSITCHAGKKSMEEGPPLWLRGQAKDKSRRQGFLESLADLA